jgi:hypothetical protein
VRPLSITIDIDRGWELVIDRPPLLELVDPCNYPGIDVMLDLAISVSAGDDDGRAALCRRRARSSRPRQ